MPDWDRGGPGGGGIGLPDADRGPGGGPDGVGAPPFFGSSPIPGGAESRGPASSGDFGAGFCVAVGGGAIVPSTTGLRESFDETMPFGKSVDGADSSTGSMSATSVGAAGASSALAATGSATSSTFAGASSTTGSSGAAGASGSAFFAAAFFAAFFGGGFFVDTAFEGFGASEASGLSSSSSGTSRINPSRSALRRTRSAWASTMLEE